MKITIFFSLLFIMGFLLLGYMHEQVHVEIFNSYDIDSHVEYFSNFPDFVTISEPITEEDCPNKCQLAHNLNEIVGYPLNIFYLIFGIGLLFIIGLIEYNGGQK